MLKSIILCVGKEYLVQKSLVWNCMNFTCCHLIKQWLNVLHAWSKIVKASKLQMDFLLYVFSCSITNTFFYLLEADSRKLKTCCLRPHFFIPWFWHQSSTQFFSLAWLLLIDYITFVSLFSHIFICIVFFFFFPRDIALFPVHTILHWFILQYLRGRLIGQS